MGSKVPEELHHSINSFLESLAGYGDGKWAGVGSQPTSVGVATGTVKLLKRLVTESEWETAAVLMDTIKQQGRQMMDRSGTWDLVIGNLVRRVLKVIREDYHSSVTSSGAAGAAGNAPMIDVSSCNEESGATSKEEDGGFNRKVADLSDKLSQSIDELSMELVTSADEISDQALEHIHANEVILTAGGRSRTVELFLKRAAAKGRTFQVIVAESAPSYSGHELAASLAKAKIQTTVITDSAILAVMSRVNKVIVGTHAIMADGGLKAQTGVYTVALAAKHYSVPFIVAASMHKLTPQYFTRADKEAFGCFVSPQEILRGVGGGANKGGVANSRMASKIHAQCPLFEYVPPDLVTLFISNMSGHAPSYVYRLLSELYHPDDYQL